MMQAMTTMMGMMIAMSMMRMPVLMAQREFVGSPQQEVGPWRIRSLVMLAGAKTPASRRRFRSAMLNAVEDLGADIRTTRVTVEYLAGIADKAGATRATAKLREAGLQLDLADRERAEAESVLWSELPHE